MSEQDMEDVDKLLELEAFGEVAVKAIEIERCGRIFSISLFTHYYIFLLGIQFRNERLYKAIKNILDTSPDFEYKGQLPRLPLEEAYEYSLKSPCTVAELFGKLFSLLKLNEEAESEA